MTDLVDLIIEVHGALDAASISHAFGGALALAHVAEPRGTVDVDVNTFLPIEESARVDQALAPIGYVRDPETSEAPVAGIRFLHDHHPYPIDVFCDLDDRYAEIGARVQHHRFGRGDDVLPFLSAEDLSVFKLSFGRTQDWADLEKIAAARPDLDVGLIEDLLLDLRGPTMHSRIARLRRLLRDR